MAVEDKIRGILGDQAWHIALLLHQLDEAHKQIKELQQKVGLHVVQNDITKEAQQ